MTHWLPGRYGGVLLAVLALAALATTALFAVAAAAYARRRSRRYLLVAGVVGLLALRTLLGIGTVLDEVPMVVHHLVAHGIDLAAAVALLYAVYRAPAHRPGDL
ncbi:DUF7471 family protein [Halobacterium yunchengense]|uniref:DUF7471 family protein n=1 Tax=Halobacterium yunchengense TaxID=3108497 RepID=UPI003008D0B3